MIGVLTLGLVRIEWDVHRRGQTIPINFQVGEITANHMPPSVFSEGYHTADAQNVIKIILMSSYTEDAYGSWPPTAARMPS